MEGFVLSGGIGSIVKGQSSRTISSRSLVVSSSGARVTAVDLRKRLQSERARGASGGFPKALGGKRFGTVVVWLRDELRLDDNVALDRAYEDATNLIVVVIYGHDRMHWRAANFMRDSISDLRESLRSQGSDLILRRGKPAEILPEFCKQTNAEALYYYRGKNQRKMKIAEDVGAQMEDLGVQCFYDFEDTLYDFKTIKFPQSELPEDCHAFTERMKDVEVPSPRERPKRIPPCPRNLHRGLLPEIQDLAFPESNNRSSVRNTPTGGETTALARLKQFVLGKTKKPPLEGGAHQDIEFGAFNAYIALGCISPRRIYENVMKDVSKASMRRYCTCFDLQLADFLTFLEFKRLEHPKAVRGLPAPI
ncbi:hypothetical protein NDN08_003382 [Rhodosorus marinus]|uniref:Photolyase/cryptochrome alpha/beta domain-containing protein n=1 Tax=Rhodosorus marinus TaxID=101924 RepID=A0AAV8UZ61_9RHOD|nr:hypothetical protein NDN08_003382 [Rhodosorus marinus]